MPERKSIFLNDEIYHITARRIGEDLLFKDVKDYYRGIFSIFELNNLNYVEIRKRRAERAQWKKKSSGSPTSATLEPDKRDKLVEILAFSFMPNHIHLLLKQIKDDGISKFMQKCCGGYARYFKEKYKELNKGYFFQNRFHATHIEDDNQLKTAFVYVHTNPIALIEPGWKENGIINPEKAIDFLENYKWSSYQDYIGKENFSSVTQREFLSEAMEGVKGCRGSVEDWIKYKQIIKK
ncbi:MAG: transposase [bacterium]